MMIMIKSAWKKRGGGQENLEENHTLLVCNWTLKAFPSLQIPSMLTASGPQEALSSSNCQ